MPDARHELVTAGFGEWTKADYAAAALAHDGSCAAVYLPTPRTVTLDLAKLEGPVTARWFDPTSGTFLKIQGSPFESAPREFAAPGKNAAGESDWVLIMGCSESSTPQPSAPN